MSALDPGRDHAELLRLSVELSLLQRELGAALERARPEVSAWAPAQHLGHVALANERVLANLAALVAGQGLLIVRGGEPHPLARQMLAAGQLPRGQAQAPRMVRPPEKFPAATLAQWLAEGEAAIRALDPARIVASELKIPHQLLGPLDAPEWLRFAVVHSAHHLAIVREILAVAPAS